MGKLKWATDLAKKGGSKVADIQKGTKPKGKKTTKWELEAEENKLAAKKVYQERKKAWQKKKIAKGESAGASDYDKQRKRSVDEQLKKPKTKTGIKERLKQDMAAKKRVEKEFYDRQYLKDK